MKRTPRSSSDVWGRFPKVELAPAYVDPGVPQVLWVQALRAIWRCWETAAPLNFSRRTLQLHTDDCRHLTAADWSTDGADHNRRCRSGHAATGRSPSENSAIKLDSLFYKILQEDGPMTKLQLQNATGNFIKVIKTDVQK